MAYVTDENLSPLIETIAWFTLATIIFALCARAVTKTTAIKAINLDDYLISLSAFFAIGQIVSVAVQANNGFGKPSHTLDEWHISNALKAGYSADILYTLSLAFSKSAVLAFIRTISPVERHRNIIAAFQALLIVVALSSVITIAFQCNLPTPWDYFHGTCIQRYPFWVFFEVWNAVTDLGLILLPAYVIRNVNVRAERKFSVISVFAIRLFAIAVEVIKLVLWSEYHDTQDPIHDLWRVVLCTQAIQCVSIVSACLLYVRSFLRLLESGFFNLDDMKRKGLPSPHTMVDSSGPADKSVEENTHPDSENRRLQARSPLEVESRENSEEIYMGRRSWMSRTPSDSNGTNRRRVEENT